MTKVGRGKPVILATRSFCTKQDAHAHFKSMLAKYSVDETVSEEDAKDLASLVLRHPEAAEKIGVGIHHFEVMSADYGTKCFAIVRKNGTREDFSYIACITANPV